MIRTLLALSAIALLFSGCVNKRGISATYYNDCREYYDMHGYYHKKCDENIIEYKEVKAGVKEALREEQPEQEKPKVW
jgi:hypothetical protein